MRLAVFVLLGAAAGLAAEDPSKTAASREGTAKAAQERVETPPPPFTEGLFPCSACHSAMPVNRVRRPLSEMHSDIVLKHDEGHRWCLDCHDAADRDIENVWADSAVLKPAQAAEVAREEPLVDGRRLAGDSVVAAQCEEPLAGAVGAAAGGDVDAPLGVELAPREAAEALLG